MAARPWSEEEATLLQAEWAGRPPGQLLCTFATARAGWRGRTAEGIRGKLRAMMIAEPDAPTEGEADPLDARLLTAITGGGTQSVEALADQLDRGPRAVREAAERLQAAGYTVALGEAGVHLERQPTAWDKTYCHPLHGKDFCFGVVSDTHLCNRYAHLEGLEILYDRFAEAGASTVYHAGDLMDGWNVYKGQMLELVCWGVDPQIEYTVEHYPRRPGIVTKFIMGNHEGHIFRSDHVDMCRHLAAGRDDMEYLGPKQAMVELGEGTRSWVMLTHPDGGTAYADSYRLQKIVEALEGGRKPNLLFCGHFHKATACPYLRNVAAHNAGCVKWQTPFMRDRAIPAHVGGYLVEGTIDGEGGLRRLRTEFIPFYREAP